jgi:hypothetical protein
MTSSTAVTLVLDAFATILSILACDILPAMVAPHTACTRHTRGTHAR